MSAASRTLATAAAYRVRNSAPVAATDIRDRSTFPAFVLAAYIFLLNSRVLDVSIMGYFHIPMILLVGLTLMMLLKGDLQFAFSSKITKYFLAYTAWVLICWPFSTWRGGSLESLQWQIQATMIFFLIVQFVRTRRDWEKIASAYAYASITASLMSFVIGVAVAGRIALPGGMLGDPNQFAIFMVVALPFWWLKAARSKGLKKILFLLCTLPIYPAIARAGSRSGMLALAALTLTTFLFANGGKRMMIAILAICGFLGAFIFLPGYLKARYFTLFSANQAYDADTTRQLSADIESSEGRKELLIQSIKMSFQHPLFGVGPGVFYMVGFEQRKAEHGGYGGQAYQTHNTYTQISSETGFPGLILFVATVVLCFRYTLQDYKRLKDIDPLFATCGRYMISSMTALGFGIFFLSVAYTYLLSIIFALCTALHIMVERYMNDREALAAASRTSQIGPGSGSSGPGPNRPPRAYIPRPKRPPRARVNRYPESLPSPANPVRT